MAVSLSPFAGAGWQFLDANGDPLENGFVHTYAVGSTTPLATFTSSAGSQANTNPIQLNASGRPTYSGSEVEIWLTTTSVYKFVVTDANGANSRTFDNIPGVASAADLASFIASLAASTGATLIGYKAAYPDSIVRTQADRDGDQISVFDFIPQSMHAAILDRSSTANPTPYIINAITDAATQRRRLWVPAGLYNITPATAFTGAPSESYLVAFPLLSNLDIDAAEGATFRIANGVSSDATPQPLAMFATNQVISNVRFRGLTFDMNGTNNPISPNRGTSWNRYVQAPIFVSSSNAVAAASAARIDNALIDDCAFQNCNGVSCIVMAQTNVANATLGSGWTLSNSRFRNNGLDTDDHTSVYGWADNVTVYGNSWYNTAQITDTGQGVAACYEVHGSNHRIFGNWGFNMLQGITIGENNTSNVFGTRIEANYFAGVKANGFNTYGVDNTTFFSVGTEIVNNTVLFDNTLHPGYPLKKGVSLDNPYGIRDVTVRGLRVQSPDSAAVASCAVSISAGTHVASNTPSQRILVEECTAVQTTFGAYVRTNAITGLGTLQIRNNNWQNLTPAGTFATAIGISIGVTASGTSYDQVVISSNDCIDNRASGTRCAYGVFIDAAVTKLSYRAGFTRNMSTADYYEETTATITARQGVFTLSPGYTPGAIVNTASVTTTVAWAGVQPGDITLANHTLNTTGVLIRSWVSAAGTISIKVTNDTGSTVTWSTGNLNLEVHCG